MIESFFDPQQTSVVAQACQRALDPERHGDSAKWRAALAALPAVEKGWKIDQGRLVAGSIVEDTESVTALLKRMIPWRKGPLRLGGINIDTEWRSDWKWDRIVPNVDVVGKRVLDIGAGNGYFGWRMLNSAARQVVGCDPTLLFWHQFKAIEHFSGVDSQLLLPLRFEQLPTGSDFDVVFSMGVLYHRKDPAEHLKRIRDHLAPGGQAVIETLIVPGEGDDELDPPDRYANMRNVHHLPTVTRLLRWLAEAGLDHPRLVDITATTTSEQKTTVWMPFHSLKEALTDDGKRTREGHPAPLRAVVVSGGCNTLRD